MDGPPLKRETLVVRFGLMDIGHVKRSLDRAFQLTDRWELSFFGSND